jgi:5'-phosphate synthase pdxT subunit
MAGAPFPVPDAARAAPLLSRGEATGGVVGVLALQGSYLLHLRALERLGAPSRKVTTPAHLEGLAGLIIPGGESTVMSHLAREYALFEPLRALGRSGTPIFGTCAGAILLGVGEGPPPRLELAPVEALRNAYGSQVDSFTAELDIEPFGEPFHGIFIRAPRLRVRPEAAASGVRVLGRYRDDPVLVACGSLLLATFHPELTGDLRLHRYFLDLVARQSGSARAAPAKRTVRASR